ncbi:hypothetical protein RJ639_011058, partial [Escallonia herrerae]
VLNMVCCWVEDSNSVANKLHISRIKDYLWVAEDGMKMQYVKITCINDRDITDVNYGMLYLLFRQYLELTLLMNTVHYLKEQMGSSETHKVHQRVQLVEVHGIATVQRVDGPLVH